MKSTTIVNAVLAGNPNCGKTTLFNYLTGSTQRTGNWPGVTVEKKHGYVKNNIGKNISVTDLPGIYSLYPYSPEETAAINCLLYDKPDIIINIVDSTNLERNLYLTTQLAELGLPIVIALNMYDILKKRGDKIDILKLEQNFGIPFVPVSANKGTGVDKLLAKAAELVENSKTQEILKVFSNSTEYVLSEIKRTLNINSRFIAIRLLENDKKTWDNTNASPAKKHYILSLINKLEKTKNLDCEMIIADERYKFICSVTSTSFIRSNGDKTQSISDKIDNIVTSRFFAVPIFILIMSLVFFVTFGSFGQAMRNCAEYIINDVFENCVKNLLVFANASSWAQSLVLDGIINGVGSVISFLPQIALLFTLLSLLEDSGYMARAIFITDKILRCIGLSGKSFVPIIMGFGCTVPAVLSTRTIENQREKQLAILISPFMSCSAKMPVYLLFSSAFFNSNATLIILLIYLIGVTAAILTALFFKDKKSSKKIPFIMELPPYRLPSFNTVCLHTWERTKDFLTKAGTILLGATVIIWFLQNFDFSLKPVTEEESILSAIGQFISPVFSICGFGNWQASVSLLTGIAAKESVASAISVLCTQEELKSIFTSLSAFSFLVFVLLYPPCIAATAAVYKETKSLKKTAFSIAYQLFAAWFASALIFQTGTLIINWSY